MCCCHHPSSRKVLRRHRRRRLGIRVLFLLAIAYCLVPTFRELAANTTTTKHTRLVAEGGGRQPFWPDRKVTGMLVECPKKDDANTPPEKYKSACACMQSTKHSGESSISSCDFNRCGADSFREETCCTERQKTGTQTCWREPWSATIDAKRGQAKAINSKTIASEANLHDRLWAR